MFRGARVTVKTLFDYLEEESVEEFLIGFRNVIRKQAERVLEWLLKTDTEVAE